MNNHATLALDLGRNLGWALCVDGKITHSGVEVLHKDGMPPGYAYANFDNFLTGFHQVDEVFYENITFFKSRYQMKLWHGFLSHLEKYCFVTGIKFHGIAVPTWKKALTTSGRSDKVQVCDYLREKGWGRGVAGTDQYNDEADACGIIIAIMRGRDVEVEFAYD